MMAESTIRSTPTRSKSRKQLGSRAYYENPDFPNGVLPTRAVILENMIYLMRPSRAGQNVRSKKSAAFLLAEILQEHWIFCNMYTINTVNIRNRILKLYDEFTKLIQTRKQRQNDVYSKKVDEFNKNADKIFDIFAKIRILEKA